MASILFLHSSPFEYPGVLCLSGYLAQKGHRVEVLVRSCEGRYFWDKARAFKPDWLGFSTVICLHHESYRLAREARKELGAPTIFGGPYVSYYPQAIEREEIDILIRGEAEEALLDFLDAHDHGYDYSSLPNVWTKRNGSIISNPVRPLEPHLDKYPIPDRHIYYKYSELRHMHSKQFMSGRGCPYNCYFCFNQAYRTLYAVKGKEIIRRHSYERVLEEVGRTQASFPLERVCFNDDIFVFDLEWLEKFLPRYRREINVPFECQVRVEMVNNDVARLLGENCCHHVLMGLESGSPRVRHEILGKKFSNQQFLRAVDMLHRHGVKVTTYNMLGCPTETLDEAIQTVKINADARVDYPWCSLYMPLPGTQAEGFARQKGLVPANFTADDLTGSIFYRSVLQQPQIREIERVQKLFYVGVSYPRFIPAIRKLAHVNLGPLYEVIFLGTHFLKNLRESEANIFRMLWLGIKRLRTYWGGQ